MSEAALQFGNVLRSWRHHRRVSQLELSAESGISQRHISFLETGRSHPSRATVLALSDSLDIPLRERNALLRSAGFNGIYEEQTLDDAAVQQFRTALELCIQHHEPYPALVLDGRWNLVMANNAALGFFGLFADTFAALARIGNPTEFQMVRLCLRDEGLKPYIENWTELVTKFLQRARRALTMNPNDEHLPALIEEILSHPEAPDHWRQPAWSMPPTPAITMVMSDGQTRYELITMLAHFGAPQHVTIEELSVETFYPANDVTRQKLEELAAVEPGA